MEVAQKMLQAEAQIYEITQVLGYNVISRFPSDRLTQAGYLSQLKLILQQPLAKKKPALKMVCLLPCLRVMDLITVSSGLTAEACILLYDPRCNWRKDTDFDFNKAVKKLDGDYKEHVGFIHNRLHALNKPMLQQKLKLAARGISMVGLYADQTDPVY